MNCRISDTTAAIVAAMLAAAGAVAVSAPTLSFAQEAAPQAAPPPPAPALPPGDGAPAPTYAPAPAAATGGDGGLKDIGPHQRPFALSLQAYVPWYYGLGIGLKTGFEIPIVHNGFIGKINNSISIEPNLSFATLSYGLTGGTNSSVIEVLPAVAGLWSFYLSPQFRVYGEVNLGYGVFLNTKASFGSINYFYYEVCAGLFYKLGDSFALRAELGWRALRGGIALLF